MHLPVALALPWLSLPVAWAPVGAAHPQPQCFSVSLLGCWFASPLAGLMGQAQAPTLGGRLSGPLIGCMPGAEAGSSMGHHPVGLELSRLRISTVA